MIENTMMLNEIHASFSVLMAMRRCQTAPSDTRGGSSSSSITSPITDFCSNCPRGGSGTNRAQIPRNKVGQANTQ